MLVEVNIEIRELGQLTALIGTDGVIVQIHQHGIDILLSSGRAIIEALEHRNLYDCRHTHGRGKRCVRVIQTTPDLVTLHHELTVQARGKEQSRHTGATISDLGFTSKIDKRGRVNSWVSTVLVDDIQVVITYDRANVLCVHMILSGRRSTIANQNITSRLLTDHDLHFIPEEVDNVKIGDIDLIVAIQTLLLIDRLWSGDSLVDLEDLVHLSLVIVPVKREALCTGLILGKISIRGLDARERSVTGAVQQNVDPVGITLVQVRIIANLMRIREEHLDVLNTVLLSGVLNPLL